MKGVFHGAPQGIFIELFDSLYTELKQKEDIISAFVSQIRYYSKFDERLKSRFPCENYQLEGTQTLYNIVKD